MKDARLTKLTDKQDAVLRFIMETVELIGQPPTYREMANAFGWTSFQSARPHVGALERKGYIAQAEGARGLHVLKNPEGQLVQLTYKVVSD